MNNAGFAVLPSHAGVDEAGRGCLVGSVFAAAVILPADFDLRGLTDSKKLSEKKRDELAVQIKAQATAYCTCRCGRNCATEYPACDYAGDETRGAGLGKAACKSVD